MKYNIGDIVCVVAGRDIGNYFVIMNIVDSQYAYLVDGKKRTIEKPKKKKFKHLVLCANSQVFYKESQTITNIFNQNSGIRDILKKFKTSVYGL